MAKNIYIYRHAVISLFLFLICLFISQAHLPGHENTETWVRSGSNLLVKRKDGTWNLALETGQKMMCALKQRDEGGTLHSKYTDLAALDAYWSKTEYESSEGEDTVTGESIPRALGALGLPTKIGSRGLVGVQYVQDKNWGGQKGTDGRYQFSMSPETGYISAEDNLSPREASRDDGGGSREPEINRLSDIYFLHWKSISGNNIANVKYFFRVNLANERTRNRIQEAIGGPPPEWPGISFDMTTDQGKVILGTANGVGVAYFLFTHKPELGVRAPTKVTVFKTIEGASEAFHLLFYIEPVRDPQD